MSTVNIDWREIRPLNGSRANGFEELCAQIAEVDCPAGSHFERKGVPDGGVECFAVLKDGNEWGWQAKYFNNLGESQWPQLDNSVKTALKKHPHLLKYFVCIPLDLADPRIEDKRSARDRWNENVKKWERWATELNMNVEFIYWGNHELLERLVHPQHVGRVRFFFDVHRFDETWFKARMEEALKTAGPRYTPEINVDLPIAAEIEAFGRTDLFFNSIKAYAQDIRKSLRHVGYFKLKSSDSELESSLSTLVSKVQVVLSELGKVAIQPTGILPFKFIAEQTAIAETATDELERLVRERERENDEESSASGAKKTINLSQNDNFRELRYSLTSLSSELRKTYDVQIHAEDVAGNSLMILKGAAGIGKTHLLCDVAMQRSKEMRPTLLLMGQRFISAGDPWNQTLQQLGLPDLSAEELVGALEAAAQAAGCRMLVLIDAINEGSGRLIWPPHLAAFLARLERSPWIAVLLSIRSSYEEIILPQNVRSRAIHITHQGFAEHEYEATRTFFVYYGLEFPSTPLLAPEFHNPLFLKTLCEGLSKTGQRRLPRGFHGITTVFDLYLNAINDRLASKFGFNRKDALVRQALKSFANELFESGERWLTLSKASEIVNSLLPGRDYERSLYYGLVSEGVLVEDAVWRRDSNRDEVVFIGYDRFADHLIAAALLAKIIGVRNVSRNSKISPALQFALKIRLSVNRLLCMNSRIRFLYEQEEYVSPGLIEALCIQIVECTGHELTELYPAARERWEIGEAFRQSLIWRAYTAFSRETFEILDSMLQYDQDREKILDVLLTVSTLPEHPLNANFLNQLLSGDSMPDRDAFWSIYLHHTWGSQGAVDRLVDWASSINPSLTIEEETIDLCSITLAWMFTSSNRFLRDRATKALVSLLSGQLGAVVRLVERFTDVDDPYVSERVYAVAYGTAMRSYDTEKVGSLASCVYDRIFENGAPPAQILLRDYARGIIKRAIYLKANIEIDVNRIRPPYLSPWPAIPTEDEIKPFLPDWSHGSYDSRDIEWARNRIGSSVMADDFARYVIGTNFMSTKWLPLRIDEPLWESPDERLDMLVRGFSENVKVVWDEFEYVDKKLNEVKIPRIIFNFELIDQELEEKGTEGNQITEVDHRIKELEQEREEALTKLFAALTPDQAELLKNIIAAKLDSNLLYPPSFDLKMLQRYILWRVFDLGWTTARFGTFDRFSVGYHGREASKSERIGKKYQWIAYHEILAHMADNFQYRERSYKDDGDRAYDGPWQDSIRDIDPSCTLRRARGGTSWDAHSPAWWAATRYENWSEPSDARDWVTNHTDLPNVEELLSVSHPDNVTRWFNVEGYFRWQQQTPADQESTDVEKREIWYVIKGYLIHDADANKFLKWAEGVAFWGDWMPKSPQTYNMFLGEHGWSPAFRYFQKQYYNNVEWIRPDHDCPIDVHLLTFKYYSRQSGFDCSVDDGYTLGLPSSELINGLDLQWTGNGADYVDAAGRLVAFDPTAHLDGPSAHLFQEDILKEYLSRERLTICWVVLGEKCVIGAGFTPSFFASLKISGAYILGDKGLEGFLKCMTDDHTIESSADKMWNKVHFS